MKAIVAMAENRAIGKEDTLPWPTIKNDFKWFKEFTTGKILVAGRNTFNKLPPLKNRNIIVLTSNHDTSSGYDPNCNFGYCFRNYDGVIEASKFSNDQLIVIGGAKTYMQFMPYIVEFYVTHVKGEYEADTFMPTFEHFFSKQEVVRAFKNENMVLLPAPGKTSIDPDALKEFDGHKVIRYSKE